MRYAGYKEESFLRRGSWTRAIFTVTFKVNRPTARTKYSGGSIVEV